MKQFGRWTLLPTTEYNWLANSHKHLAEDLAFEYQIGVYLRNQLQDLAQVSSVAEDRRRIERKASFTAGKFHAAGGYAKALKDARARIIDLHRTLDRWRPFVEALETTPGQLTINSDVSDANAAADLFAVRTQVAQERRLT